MTNYLAKKVFSMNNQLSNLVRNGLRLTFRPVRQRTLLCIAAWSLLSVLPATAAEGGPFMKVWKAGPEAQDAILEKMPLPKSYQALQTFYKIDQESKKYSKVNLPDGKTLSSGKWSDKKKGLEKKLEKAVLGKLTASPQSNAFIENLSIAGAKSLINLYKNNYKKEHGAWLDDYTAVIQRLALQESISKEQKRLDSYLLVLTLAAVLFGGFLGFILWEQRKLKAE